MSSAYDHVVIDGVRFPGVLEAPALGGASMPDDEYRAACKSAVSSIGELARLPADVRIVDRGRRERRREARAGVRGRRGSRRVPPCPMYLFEMRQKLDPEMVRQVREAIAKWSHSPPNCIVLPGEFEVEVVEPTHNAAPSVKG